MPLRTLPLDPAAEARRRGRLLDARAAALAHRREGLTAAPSGTAVLICAVGEALYGLPLARLAEVLPAGAVTPLSGTPPAVLGLVGRMGHFVCVIDLGTAVGQALPAGGAGGHLVMLRRAEGSRERRLALRVDRALQVGRVVPIAEGGSAGGLVSFRGRLPLAAETVAGGAITGGTATGGRAPGSAGPMPPGSLSPGSVSPGSMFPGPLFPGSGSSEPVSPEPDGRSAPLVSVLDDARLLEPFLLSSLPGA